MNFNEYSSKACVRYCFKTGTNGLYSLACFKYFKQIDESKNAFKHSLNSSWMVQPMEQLKCRDGRFSRSVDNKGNVIVYPLLSFFKEEALYQCQSACWS